MRFSLAKLDTNGVALELPRGRDGLSQSVIVQSAQGLRGTAEVEQGLVRIAQAAADAVACEAVGLIFGKCRLSEGGFLMRDSFLELEKRGEHLVIDAGTGGIEAGSSAVDVGPFHVEGSVHLEQMKLTVRDGEGSIEIGRIDVRGFRMRDPKIAASAEQVTTRGLVIGWGTGGLRLDAQSFEAPELRASAFGVGLEARGVRATQVTWSGGTARLGSIAVSEGKLVGAVDLAPIFSQIEERVVSRAGKPRPEMPKVVADILDGLFGHFNVDVTVELKLPVVGARAPVHEFRVPIQAGTINYRTLESNLSTLEDALFDFAVRDGNLALELGIPLLPTRGRGKQLLVWKLDDADLALAEHEKVRLAVLPRAQLALELPKRATSQGTLLASQDSPFGLSRVAIEGLDALLGASYGTGTESPLRRLEFEQLSLGGNLTATADPLGLRGDLTGGIRHLHVELRDLVWGSNRLTFEHALTQSARFEAKAGADRTMQVSATMNGFELVGTTFSSAFKSAVQAAASATASRLATRARERAAAVGSLASRGVPRGGPAQARPTRSSRPGRASAGPPVSRRIVQPPRKPH